MKKIILIVVCFIVLFSCGRKGDPEYQASKCEIVIRKV